MGLEQRITALEDEIKVLKNEIKAVLLDIREHYLQLSNPFTSLNTLKVPSVDESDGLTNDQDKYVIEEGKHTSRNSKPPILSKPAEIKEEPAMHDHQFVTAEPSASDLEMLHSVENHSIPARPKRQSFRTTHDSSFDLVVIAGLTQWVDQATATLGKERAEALVEIAYTMRHFSTEVRDALIRLIRLSPRENGISKMIGAKDYLAVLAQLDNLLANEHHENTLLSILTMMKEASDG